MSGKVRVFLENNSVQIDGDPFGSAAPLTLDFTRVNGVPEGGSVMGDFCMLNDNTGALKITIEGDPLQDFDHGRYGFSSLIEEGNLRSILRKLKAIMNGRSPKDVLSGRILYDPDQDPEKEMNQRTFLFSKKITAIEEAVIGTYFDGAANLRRAFSLKNDANGKPTTQIEFLELQISGKPNGHPHWRGQENAMN